MVLGSKSLRGTMPAKVQYKTAVQDKIDVRSKAYTTRERIYAPMA